jgi:hypothetical protein
MQRNSLAASLAEGGARAAARSPNDMQAAQAVTAMSQRLLQRLEEPLRDVLAFASRPVVEPSVLPLPEALRDAGGAVLTPAALLLLALLTVVVATSAAAAAAAAAAGAGLRPGGGALQTEPGPAPQREQQQQLLAGDGPPRPLFRAPALIGLVATAAVLLRVAWAPLLSSLQAAAAAAPPGGMVAAAASTYAALSGVLTWGSTAIAVGALARLLLTAAPRAAAAEAVGAVVIAAALHKALLLADTLCALASELPLAAKARAGASFIAYALAVEALTAATEEQRAALAL